MPHRVLQFVPLVCLFACPAGAQVDIPRPAPEEFSESLYLDVLAFAGQSPGENRLDAYLQIGYDNLSFVKEGDLYNASYEVTISVNDSTGAFVSEKSWTEQIKGISFDASTASGAYALVQRSFTLKPGQYTVNAMVQDLDSKTMKKTGRPRPVPDFNASAMSMSDIMLVSRLTVAGAKKSILPNISPNVGNLPNAFYTFCEVYSQTVVDSIRFVARVYNAKTELMLETDTVEYVKAGRNDLFMRIPHNALPLGDYALVIRAYPASKPHDPDAGFITGRTRAFIIRWMGLPRALKDIDTAINQLQYIAKDGEMTVLKDTVTIEEKQKRFLEFWKKRDPNPNTPRNEKMEEYYARVDYANKHFTRYREGWRTDMGLVFIVLGPPSSVDRHPFEVDSKPYEVWSYYDLNYQYVFLDDTGFGDYRLITPLWEVYNRRRQ